MKTLRNGENCLCVDLDASGIDWGQMSTLFDSSGLKADDKAEMSSIICVGKAYINTIFFFFLKKSKTPFFYN